MKSVLWRVAKRPSYIEDAWCLKVHLFQQNFGAGRGCSHKWVACHHSMALPQVADGGDDFQLRWATAKKSDSGQPPNSNAPLPASGKRLTIPRTRNDSAL